MLVFELAPSSQDPFECKEQGSLLFGLRDFSSAQSLYSRALSLLRAALPLTTGAAVLMTTSNDPYSGVMATVICIEADGRAVVMADSDSSEEERICSAENLWPAGPEATKERELARALYMNLGRCSIKLGRRGWAVRWLTFALVLARDSVPTSSSSSSSSSVKHIADALTLRCRVYLGFGKVGLARRDAMDLRPFDSARSDQLLVEVARKKDEKKKMDRRLARDISRWVEDAMQPRAAGNGSDINGDAESDLNFPHDDDENDDEA